MLQFFNHAREFLPILLQGAWLTILVTLGSLLLSTLLGLVWAIMRVSGIPLLANLSAAIINLLRGIPIIVILFFLYFVMPDVGISLSALQAGILGLGIAYSAYQAENFRAGIEAVDPGQLEAARAMGMGWGLMMRRVVLPQAVKIVLPPYGNIMIMMLKDSSQASTITVAELGSVDVSAQPQQNRSKSQHFHEMTGFFFVASSNAAKVFELAKHAFNDMTLLVQAPVAASLLLSVRLGWNHRHNLTLPKPLKQGISVIPLVRQQRASADVLHKWDALGDVCRLPCGQNETHGQAQCICQRMNLATKPTTGAPQRLSSRVTCGRARSARMRPHHGAVDADILQICLS